VGLALGLALALGGRLAGHARLARSGVAALVAVAVAGLAANLAKAALGLPRPLGPEDWGFPSGHTSTAFALAAVLGRAFPAGAPWLYLLAVLAMTARLYARAHFVADVLGGVVVGTAAGLLAARWLLPAAPARPGRAAPRFRLAAMALPVAVGLGALALFALYERSLEAYRVAATPGAGGQAPAGATGTPPLLTLAFGTREARAFMDTGWSADEPGFVWAEGLEARLTLPAGGPAAYRVRLTMRPWIGHGRRLSCQITGVAVNGATVARLHLDHGWHAYEVRVPRDLVRAGPNRLAFRFAYAELPGSPGAAADPRRLGAAFRRLEIRPDPS
jgi:hypothetical protein